MYILVEEVLCLFNEQLADGRGRRTVYPCRKGFVSLVLGLLKWIGDLVTETRKYLILQNMLKNFKSPCEKSANR